MLDFFDYNFSSLISIFAALMGIAYPLVLQAIQRIDEMYKSTKLAAFFLKQWYFRLFSCLLLLTIPISIVVPFLLCSCNDNWMLIVSAVYAIIVFTLAMSTFVLFAENGGYPPTQNGDIRSLFWLFSLMALQN